MSVKVHGYVGTGLLFALNCPECTLVDTISRFNTE